MKERERETEILEKMTREKERARKKEKKMKKISC